VQFISPSIAKKIEGCKLKSRSYNSGGELQARLDRKQSQISVITAMVLRSQLSNPDELDALFPGMDIPELEAPEASSFSIEERRMRAGAIERAKWWAFGMPEED